MINFKGLKDLFTILTVKHNPKKHWSDFTWWGIVESMNDLLLESIRKAINGASFLFVNSNEVIVIDHTSWIFIHLYAVQVWKWIPLLVCVEKVGVHVTIIFKKN
jgi:hypothetical protein